MKGVPHDWELERTLIGGLLLDCGQIPDVAGIVRVDDFARPNHRALFRVILDLYERDKAVDFVTLIGHAEDAGDLETFGGAAYLAALSSACPSVDNLPVYARKVRGFAMRRGLRATGQGITELTDDPTRTPEELYDVAQAMLSEVGATVQEVRPLAPLPELVDARMRAIEERAANPGAITGVPVGIADLDRLLCGLQPSDQVILAARPAMGKTAFALNAAIHAARSGVAVGFYSLEMSREQLVDRALAQIAGVSATGLREGRVDSDAWRRLNAAADELSRLPIHIDDRGGIPVATLRQRARRLHRQHRVGLFVLDYLGMLSATMPRMDKTANTTHDSQQLKNLWKEIRVPGLVLCQLNRSLESRSDKRPTLSDLRDSGAIEQDADVVLALYRDEVYNPDTADRGTAEVLVLKQRSGPIGVVHAAYIAELTKFMDLTREHAPTDTGRPLRPVGRPASVEDIRRQIGRLVTGHNVARHDDEPYLRHLTGIDLEALVAGVDHLLRHPGAKMPSPVQVGSACRRGRAPSREREGVMW